MPRLVASNLSPEEYARLKVRKNGSDAEEGVKDVVTSAANPAPDGTATVASLFRYATPLDRGLIVMSQLTAMGHGVVMPVFALLFGDIINSFNSPGGLQATFHI